MYLIIFFVIVIAAGFYSYGWKQKTKKACSIPNATFPSDWKTILNNEIPFYRALSNEEQKIFENKIQAFLSNIKIIGVDTEITDLERILVASSAVIPIFGFANWSYCNLHEVLIYPSAFNMNFEIEGPERSILGMVGTGYMNGKMILSKEALLHGFENISDKKNTAIHEFTHLIDKVDGTIDGIPAAFLEKEYILPWIDYIDKKMDEIFDGDSDINPYGGKNRAEFFSVISEYFFERPKLLQNKHPQLYDLLEKIFQQDLTIRDISSKVEKISRNALCPCNSGDKYKKCCGSVVL